MLASSVPIPLSYYCATAIGNRIDYLSRHPRYQSSRGQASEGAWNSEERGRWRDAEIPVCLVPLPF